MIWLIVSGIVVLVFGILFFFFGALCKHPSEVCDRVLFVLDDILNPYRIPVGIVLLAVGAWILYLVMQYPENYLLHLVWVILMVFGLFYVFLPHWQARISATMNRTVFNTDRFVMRFCKTVGVILLLAAAYIVYASLSIR
jgi:hypothetical protein